MDGPPKLPHQKVAHWSLGKFIEKVAHSTKLQLDLYIEKVAHSKKLQLNLRLSTRTTVARYELCNQPFSSTKYRSFYINNMLIGRLRYVAVSPAWGSVHLLVDSYSNVAISPFLVICRPLACFSCVLCGNLHVFVGCRPSVMYTYLFVRSALTISAACSWCDPCALPAICFDSIGVTSTEPLLFHRLFFDDLRAGSRLGMLFENHVKFPSMPCSEESWKSHDTPALKFAKSSSPLALQGGFLKFSRYAKFPPMPYTLPLRQCWRKDYMVGTRRNPASFEIR